MTISARVICALMLPATLAACVTWNIGGNGFDTVTVTGALAYRERIALPPDSTARVTISDVSVADRKAPVTVDKRIALGKQQVPIDFTLTVARQQLQAGHRYSVRGTIRDPAGKLIWTTDTAYPVDRDSAVNNLHTLRLVQVGAQKASRAARSAEKASLVGPEWVVEDINGGGIIDSSHMTLNFDKAGRLYGYAGCNHYRSNYQRHGQDLVVRQIAGTLRACAPALNKQERRFFDVLKDVRSFAFDPTGKLVIQAAGGKTMTAYPAKPDTPETDSPG